MPPTWQEGQIQVRVIVIVMQSQALQHFQSCVAYIQTKDGIWSSAAFAP